VATSVIWFPFFCVSEAFFLVMFADHANKVVGLDGH
jgi:hypothetical protein